MIAGLRPPRRRPHPARRRRPRRPPPEARPVRTVFQSYALFPHMTVEGNVAFPLQMAKTPAGRDPAKVAEALEDVRLDRLRQALSARALRRPEAARRDRPRAGHAPDGAAARRAARRARREAARGNADRAHQPAEGGRHHVRLRDARPDRGARAVAPDRRDEPRATSSSSTSRRGSTASRRRASSPTSSATATCCPGRCAANAGGIVTRRRRRARAGARRRDVGDRRRAGPAPIALRPEKIRIDAAAPADTPDNHCRGTVVRPALHGRRDRLQASTRRAGARSRRCSPTRRAAAPSSSKSATRSK